MPSHFEAHETYNGKWAQNYQTKLVISSVSSGQAVPDGCEFTKAPSAQTRYGIHQFSKAFKMSGIRWLMLTTT